MSKREDSKSNLHYLVLAIMLVAFGAVAATTSQAAPDVPALHSQT